jgi:hypothetical protein
MAVFSFDLAGSGYVLEPPIWHQVP